MNVIFGKPATYSGVRRIEVKRWREDYGFHVTALCLERWPGEPTWCLVRPAQSAIWTADGRILCPARPKVILAEGLTLRQARQLALEALAQEGT